MSHNMEFREVPQFPGYYCSRDGVILHKQKTGIWAVTNPRFSGAGGYPMVNLFVGNRKRITWHVHRVVAETWLPPKPSPEYEINHKNGIVLDNRVENLEWVTRKQNNTHKRVVLDSTYQVKRGHKNSGENNGSAKLKEHQVRKIKSMLELGIPKTRIANHFEVSPGLVTMIGKGKIWSHVA